MPSASIRRNLTALGPFDLVLALYVALMLVLLLAVLVRWLIRRMGTGKPEAAYDFQGALEAAQAAAGDDGAWTMEVDGTTVWGKVTGGGEQVRGYHLIADVTPTQATNGAPFRGALPGLLPSLPRVVFRAETATDVWAKRLRINRELQLDDDDFDPHVYVESDADDETLNAILARPVLRRAVVRLVERGARTVTLNGTLAPVEATWRPPFERDPFEEGQLLDSARDLAALTEALPPVANVGELTPARRGAKLLTASLGVAVLGFALVVVGQFHAHPLHAGLYERALGLSAMATVVMSLLTLGLLRGRSDAFRQWLTISLIWLAGLPLVGIGGSVIVNQRFGEAPTWREVTVTYRDASGGESPRYHIGLAPLGDHAAPARIRVSKREYQQLRVGEPARALIGDGALGVRFYADAIEPR